MTSSLCEDSQEPLPSTHALVGPVWIEAGMSGFTSWSAASLSTRVALFQPAPSKQPFNCGSGVSRRRSCVVVGRVRATSAPMAIPATNSLRRAGASSSFAASASCAALIRSAFCVAWGCWKFYIAEWLYRCSTGGALSLLRDSVRQLGRVNGCFFAIFEPRAAFFLPGQLLAL